MKQQIALPVLGLLTVAVLSACGAGSGDDGTAAGGNVAASVPVSDLQRNAARNASANLGASLGGLERLFSDAAPFADDFVGDDEASGVDGTGSPEENTTSVPDISPMVDQTESMADKLLHASLGLDEGGLSRSSRSGSRVTVDPDDAAVCASIDPDLYDENLADADTLNDRSTCEALVSHLIVQIDADSEESGLITYQFDQQPLLLVGYSPSEASFDLNLGTLREVIVVAEALKGEESSVPSLMEGRVKIAAMVSNSSFGQEAGSVSLSVPAAIRIVDDSVGIDISQSATSGFVLTADESTGTASVDFNTGVLNASINQADAGETPSVISLSLPGFTGRVDLINDGSRLVVSQLGLGNGPLSLSLDNVEVLSVALAPFGFTVDEADGLVVFDADLDLALALGNILPGVSDGDFQLNATLQGPAGTRLLGGASGDELVSGGGPLSLNYRLDLDGSTETNFTTWSVGSCEQSFAATENSGILIGCN